MEKERREGKTENNENKDTGVEENENNKEKK